MKKSKFLKILVAMATATSIAACAFPALADDTTNTGTGSVNGSVGINGTILPLQISVTHEITESYSIDPNAGTFSAAPIIVKNNTKVPVNVSVQSISSAAGGDLQFTDVLPDAEDWNNLNNTDSKKYIALGAKITNGSGWNSGYFSGTDWAAAKTPVTFGSLPSGATGNIELTAKNGFAFDKSYTAKADVVIMVNLV